MKHLFLFFFVCCSLPLLGQDLIKQTNNLAHPYSKEVYYVLKADPAIKSGAYKKYFSGTKLAENGRFEANQRVGTWQYYNPQGEVEQQYNWTSNTLESARPFTGVECVGIEENGVFTDQKPDECPIFLGGTPTLHRYILYVLRYPAQALRNNKTGIVHISATITPDGQMINEQVAQGLGYGLDEEALRVFKTITGEWIPGKVNGKPVNTKIVWPFRFGLQ
jgi:TonB family protein